MIELKYQIEVIVVWVAQKNIAIQYYTAPA